MSTHASAIANVKSWDEQPYDETPDTPKTSRARIHYEYQGDVAGESDAELLMVYVGEEAEYVGLERVTATIASRSGTFVTSAVGAFRGGVAASSWNVVPGSGTGELQGLSGSGNLEAPSGHQANITLDYEFG